MAGEEVPKRKAKAVSRRKISKKIEYIPNEFQLKRNGYELIITEKPQAASKIAESLGKAVRRNVAGV